MRRQSNKTMKNFEIRFEVQLFQLDENDAGIVSESLVAFMLLANAQLQESQRVSILAAPVSGTLKIKDSVQPTSAELLKKVQYD